MLWLVGSTLSAVLVPQPAGAQESAFDTPIGGPSEEQERIVSDVLGPICADGDVRACAEMTMLLKAIAEQRSGDYRDTLRLVTEGTRTRRSGMCELALDLGRKLMDAPRGSAPRENVAPKFLSEACLGCGPTLCRVYQEHFGRSVPSIGRAGRTSGLAMRIAGSTLIASWLFMWVVPDSSWTRKAGPLWWSVGAGGAALVAGGQWLRIQGQVRAVTADPELSYTPTWFWIGVGIQAVGVATNAGLSRAGTSMQVWNQLALAASVSASAYAMSKASDEAAQWALSLWTPESASVQPLSGAGGVMLTWRF